jgi:hypothetical protein
VVAELVPPQPGRSPLVGDAMLADAVRQGWVTPPAMAGDGAPPRRPVTRLSRLMSGLARDRADR